MAMTLGIDWSEKHHDYELMNGIGERVAAGRISNGANGFGELLAVLIEHTDDHTAIPVAIETDKNLLIVALQGAGMTVHAINPRAVARYRERHQQAGGKSDPGDARVLADILRTDLHRHRPLPAITDDALGVRALARQHQEAIWARQQTVSRLRSVLIEFYPNAIAAFDDLTHKAALMILADAPTPQAARRLTPKRVAMLLRRSRRGNRSGLAERWSATLRQEALRQPPPVEQALGITVTGLVAIIEQMQTAIAELESALNEAFAQHHTAPIMRSAPGLGAVLAARILAEIGDDPERFATAAGLRSFAGTAPITRASGRSKVVSARHVRNRRLADALHWWAFNAISRSPGARAHYDRRRAAGDSHNAALRNVANKLTGRLWWCLHHNQPWDDNAAWPRPLDTAAA